ncbi:hypothetical protein [uncultured Dokdonia sp.]|uniref:hypothetical protein n=1 Tax=uncultured Dokdonia sp. TaxID=575653 RepID=UPI0026139303|nr:hypothetical protein [uncultured Dokdonia sp.]
MAYPERKPIYETYKKIIIEIISSKEHREYANGEIDELDKDLIKAFKEIRNVTMLSKEWNKD